MSKDIPQVVKDFADAASGAAEIQNRYWLALLAFSAFVLAPRPTMDHTITLPLELGAVPRAWFFFVAVAILSVLLIAFGSAHAQVIRTHKLALELLRVRRVQGSLIAGMDEREAFDALRRPSLSRVSSIALVLRGKHQFYVTKPECPLWKLWVSAAVYVLLKIVAILALFIVPAGALALTVFRYTEAPPPPGLPGAVAIGVWLFVGSATLVWLVAIWTEVEYVARALPAIASRKVKAG